MTTPRVARLVRVPSLAAFQRAIVFAACEGGVSLVRATAVLVPTRAAALQLRRTIEHERLTEASPGLVFPDVLTRTEWYERLRTAMRVPVRWLSRVEREVMLQAGALEAVTEGAVPPFHLRPTLVAEMLDLYDGLRRRQRTIDDFDRLLTGELEPRAVADRGAERILRQTRFLVAAFASYERRVRAAAAADEHVLRDALLDDGMHAAPYRRVIVTVGDQAVEAGGLWPGDFDLCSRLSGIERVEVVATEAQLAAGFHRRVHDFMPGLEEVRPPEPPLAFEPGVLDVPDASEALHFTDRDREEEMASVARRIKAARRSSDAGVRLDRTAVVFARPLPYLYMARVVFDAARVPYQSDEALPLAAEPVAAALDVLLAFVGSGASRAATVALLGSPHFALDPAGGRVDATAVQALDVALAEERYRGDPARLVALAAEWAAAADTASEPRLAAARRGALAAVRAAATAVAELRPLFTTAPASMLLRTLGRFLLERGCVPSEVEPVRERLLRTRAALLATVDALGHAHEAHGDLNWGVDDLSAALRRWLEDQTSPPRAWSTGVHLVDAASARFGAFDSVHLVGLVEGEWPEPPRRNLFYSAFLLAQLGWPDDSARAAAARATFADLLGLASRHTAVSSFLLEEDSLVEPSSLLELVPRAGLSARARAPDDTRVFVGDALAAGLVPAGVLPGEIERWAHLRLSRTPSRDPGYHGSALPHHRRSYGVGSIELYAQCPFKYFCRYVLRLEEEPDRDEAMSARERGIFAHEVFRAFFERWQAAGHGAITPGLLDQARALLEAVAVPLLERLAPADAALERTRLFGSPAAYGLADLVLRMEAERPTPVLGRMLEDAFEGVFELQGESGPRELPVRGVVDRVDLLADGALRVIDYKSSLIAEPMQLAIYSVTAVQRLQGRLGRQWVGGEAAYIVCNAGRGVKPLGKSAEHRGRVLADAQARFVAATEAIAAGQFPPRPAQAHLCASCAYAGVCRKDHVAEIEPSDAAAAV